MTREYTIKEEGYVFMYVSNENATLVDVYFDDVVMTHTKSNLVQYNEYYPFGLQTANSWTRESNTGNNFLANGGTELNTTSNLYDLQYRNYDPVLGRMNQVDPMATKYASLTPYNFSFNDPVYYNDPMGDDANDQAMSYYQQLSKAINRNNNREQWERERSEGWRSTTNKMQMFGVVGDDDLFPKLGIGSGNGSLSHQGFEEANVRARETGGKVAYSAGEYWTETQILEFVIDPLFIGYSPGVLAIKNQTQGYNIRTSISSSSQFFSSATNGGGLPRLNDPGYGFALSMVETAFISGARDLGILRPTSSRALAKRTLNAFTKTSLQTVRYSIRGSGMIGFVVGAGIGTYNIANGNGQLSDALDIGVTVLGGAAIFFASAAAAPAVITGVAAGSLIYGGFMLFGGEDYINNSSLGKSTKSLLNFGN